jgi:FlaG/FlaF family flagellin (archaellin)
MVMENPPAAPPRLAVSEVVAVVLAVAVVVAVAAVVPTLHRGCTYGSRA